MSNEPRTCIMCRYWWIEFEADWSDITPGDGFSSGCNKDHWRTSDSGLSAESYRRFLLKAEECSDYEGERDVSSTR